MTETISKTDQNLILLDEIDDFRSHGLKLVEESSREVLLLSKELDPLLYHGELFSNRLLGFVRNDHRCRVKILVKNIRPLVEKGHRLLTLAQRLPSKIEIHKLLIEPQNDAITFMMGDRRILLYQHEDQMYNGFVNYNGAPESKSFAEEFTYLWEQHSELDSSLRSFVI